MHETVLAQLGHWLEDYNRQAPHSALGMRPPAEYLFLTEMPLLPYEVTCSKRISFNLLATCP
jgi:hypothetical protein